jgi:hypothetical protein
MHSWMYAYMSRAHVYTQYVYKQNTKYMHAYTFIAAHKYMHTQPCLRGAKF